jgi:predicted nuclease of predicted toxin-antitoxin system
LHFLLDMGVSYKVARWLNDIEHDAIHLSDQGLNKLSDDQIIEKAVAENRIILTADVDFGQLLAFKKSSPASVIQFRIFDLTPENIIPKLELIFDRFLEELNNEPVIITVQEHKIRLKKI